MNLRPYQLNASDAVVAEFLKGTPSTLVVMPTGTGKTVLFASLILRIAEWSLVARRVLVLAHREELITQAAIKIHAVTGYHPDIEMAGQRADINMFHRAQVVIASKDTLRGARLRRFDPSEFGLIVTDEAHHAVAKSYTDIYDHFAGVPHVGVTATPDRLDREKLGRVFKSVAFDYQLSKAINDGWLCPIRQRYVQIESLDYSQVHTNSDGDLNGRELSELLGSEEILQQQVSATLGEARGRKTLVFATPGYKTIGGDKGETFRVCERMTEIFNRHQPDVARLVTGETPKDQRAQILSDYKLGLFQILVNVGVFTEGFDDPTIELVVMARATESRALYAQIIGRGTRPLPGLVDGLATAEERRAAIAASAKPFCEVLDFEGNAGTHKLIHVTDILGEDYTEEEIAKANKIIDRSKGAKDAKTALEEAREEVKRDKAAAEFKKHWDNSIAVKEAADRFRRAWIKGTAKWESREIDPFNPYELDQTINTRENAPPPPTEKQLNALRKFGYTKLDGITRRQASGILAKEFAKLDERKQRAAQSISRAMTGGAA